MAEVTWLSPLFGADVVTAQGKPELVDDQLYPEELASIARAVPKRRAEFGAVRVCARRALAELGIAAQSLAPHPDRAPRWPEGIVGSLTHTASYCAAVVAKASAVRSVGVDAERERTLEPELRRMICTEREQQLLAAEDAIVCFAAKEAFYKCQYPLTGRYLDFLDVEVDFEGGKFTVSIIKPGVEQFGGAGKFLRRDGLVLCGYELR